MVVPDLLGQGRSCHLGTSFALPEQVAAVRRLLDHLHLREVVLVGHSDGCAVAVAVAAQDPRVERLVLVRPPAYANAGEAADRFSRRSWLARRTVAGAPAASVICGAMCLLRPALQHAAPRLAPACRRRSPAAVSSTPTRPTALRCEPCSPTTLSRPASATLTRRRRW